MNETSHQSTNGDHREQILGRRIGAFQLSLEPSEGAPQRARAALDELAADMDSGVRERGAVVLSELVTNSIKHAHMSEAERIRVSVAVRPDFIRMEVTDPGEGFEIVAITPGSSDGGGGWGLWLIEKMTDRWGVDFSHSTNIWCEFDTP